MWGSGRGPSSGRDAASDRNTGRPVRASSRTMRARYAIARRQIARRIVARHERLAVGVDQPGAFAPQRLGQQEARLRPRPGARSDGTARTRGQRRARRRDRPSRSRRRTRPRGWSSRGTPGRRRRSRAASARARAVAVSPSGSRELDADGAAVLDEDRGGERVLDGLDARLRRGAGPQGPPISGRWCRARAARGGRCAPPRAPSANSPSAGDRRRAPVHQLVDVARALGDENPHRVDVAEAVAGGQRVLLVQRAGSRPRPPPRRCRPGRSRCCPRPTPPWSAGARGRTRASAARRGARRCRCRR